MGLWDVLASDPDPQNIANVKWLVEYAEGKLLLIRETFPDYTRHDARHSKNVIALAEKLLGRAIDHLRPLEAAMLILAAYFHDIGMVYNPDELAVLTEEEDFRDFLDDNPTAYVRAHEGTEIPLDIIVQYCRARHADRVAEHLFRLDASRLAWDGVPIGEALTNVCQSHMKPLQALRSEQFPTAFLGSCDLRMSAILLRLADILDLDDTRSPIAVYDHLQLAGETDRTRMVSDAEWTKHMASHGFRFPQERTPNYALPFHSSPRNPAVEHTIRKFLDAVDDELRGCRILLDFCDPRWRSLALPGSIERSGIRGIGYRYGEYRFDLDREAVLRLFMGDQLYSNPYVFIRELLQNAIDACRLNVYLHDAAASAMEVRVSAWEDGAGSFWLRVDDNGTGMDLGIVERYFLGVGRSYYRSDELQADILRRNKSQQKFEAISRFGIGVLSSFIVGDRVEVSTRRRLPDGKLAPPLRLSLDSLDEFFVMQDPPMAPAPFPGRAGDEAGYRKSAGTSVAVRIDPAKADVTLDGLLDTARSSLFFPPVRVFLNDVEDRDDRLDLLDAPLIKSVARHRVSARDEFLMGDERLWSTSEVSVVALPLDLTAHSPSPGIRGQLVAVMGEASGSASLLAAFPPELRRKVPKKLAHALARCITGREASVEESGLDESLTVTLRVYCRETTLRRLHSWSSEQGIGKSEYTILREAEQALEHFDIFHNPSEDPFLSVSHKLSKNVIVGDTTAGRLAAGWLGHNGIRVSTARPNRGEPYERKLKLEIYGDIALFGPVCLFDALRPDVSVSRDAILGLSFEIRSALHLSVRRAASRHLDSPESDFAAGIMRQQLLSSLPLNGLTLARAESDPLASQWHAERIIETENGKLASVDELHAKAKVRPFILKVPLSRWYGYLSEYSQYSAINFYETISLAIAELELELELIKPPPAKGDGSGWYSISVCSAARPALPSGASVLPPFAVVRYSEPGILIAPECPVNLRHPVGAWFADHAAMLGTNYPALFVQFKRALAMVAVLRFEAKGKQRQAADNAAELLNTTLDRIRRAVPDLPSDLSQEIYADDEYCLRSR